MRYRWGGNTHLKINVNPQHWQRDSDGRSFVYLDSKDKLHWWSTEYDSRGLAHPEDLVEDLMCTECDKVWGSL